MSRARPHARRLATLALAVPLAACGGGATDAAHAVTVRNAVVHDRSAPLAELARVATNADAMPPVVPRGTLAPPRDGTIGAGEDDVRALPPVVPVAAGGAQVEQRRMGRGPAPALVATFEGLGASFPGGNVPPLRNPSDNSLAVGPNHIVQVVNTRLAVFTKRGARHDTTGRVLLGPVPTHVLFRGFGGPCELRNNGDAVARYDQLARRWLVVMPLFTRGRVGEAHAAPPVAGGTAGESEAGIAEQPGRARPLDTLPPPPPAPPRAAPGDTAGTYGMCYAVSTGDDPLGAWYRYEFIRPLFPDYPRPAVWPDGYYVPTSTGDDVIQKHACVAERARMLRGEPAREQCFVLDGVNFLNNVDLDGAALPPAGLPNLVLATGGTQLKGALGDDALYAWRMRVDWDDPARSRLDGPERLAVAPYAYLCGGQLTRCVPQPGTPQRLDAQGDKLMPRVTYRRLGRQQSIVAAHAVATSDGGGGVRWYELRLDARGRLRVHQQGTYAPDGGYRWLASPAMDGAGNIGIGYSWGDSLHAPGQRFAGRRAGDPPGQLPLRERVLAEGAGVQSHTLRWEDYTQTAVDPSDDCTIWYVGDHLRAADSTYATRIGGFRLPGCPARTVR